MNYTSFYTTILPAMVLSERDAFGILIFVTIFALLVYIAITIYKAYQ